MATSQGASRLARAATLWPLFVGLLVIFLWPRERDDAPDEDTLPTPDAEAPRPAAARGSLPRTPGTLEARDVLLSLPAAEVLATDCNLAQPPWILPGYTASRVEELLTAARVPPRVRGLLQAGQRCDARRCVLTPTTAALRELTAESRAVLYPALGEFADNPLYMYPFERRAEVEPWTAAATLPPAGRALLARYSYRHGPFVAFADRPLLCDAIPRDDERQAVLRVLRARESVELTLRVRPGEDLAPIARYWASGSSERAVRIRLERAVAEGRPIPLRELLPSASASRLGTYAPPGGRAYDCFWTALHFYGGDDPMNGVAGFAETLRTRYTRVTAAEATFGDLVVLFGPDGLPAHAANFLTERYAYTKNGASHLRPWGILRIDDLRAEYPMAPELQYWRRRPTADVP
ncbi:MAG: hypothetical protein HY909_09745 [Deltaproteobacteria bacterium]|nr:hypothetical protein [Deltaproteobacteria bacterium]